MNDSTAQLIEPVLEESVTTEDHQHLYDDERSSMDGMSDLEDNYWSDNDMSDEYSDQSIYSPTDECIDQQAVSASEDECSCASSNVSGEDDTTEDDT